MYSWDELQSASKTIKTTDVKGKDYAEVHQRIKAFRMVCPMGCISTEMMSNEGGVCIFKACVYDETGKLLGTGTAYEKEDSSYINKTSYIENCETSAVGRALGMCGFGIDLSVASALEVANAARHERSEWCNASERGNVSERVANNQNKKPKAKPMPKPAVSYDGLREALAKAGFDEAWVCEQYKVKSLEELNAKQIEKLMERCNNAG